MTVRSLCKIFLKRTRGVSHHESHYFEAQTTVGVQTSGPHPSDWLSRLSALWLSMAFLALKAIKSHEKPSKADLQVS